jgi:hypothetical protein
MRKLPGLVPIVLGALLAPAVAQALTCAGAGRISALYPAWPFRTPAGSDIWQHCSGAACVAPELEVAGVAIPLVEVDRHAVTPLGNEWSGGKWLVRYRPSQALSPGPDQHLTPPGGLPFEVVSDEEGIPRPPPRLLGISYEAHVLTAGGDIPLAASFYIELDDRMLVVDAGEPDEDPLQNLAFDETFTVPYETSNPGALLYRLGTTECGSTFLETAPGVTTQVRFGFVDGRGRFSGWTGFYAVEFPEVGEKVWIPAPEAISAPLELEAPADDADTSSAPSPAVPEAITDDETIVPTNPATARSASGCGVIPSRSSSHATWWLALLPLLAPLLRRPRRP